MTERWWFRLHSSFSCISETETDWRIRPTRACDHLATQPQGIASPISSCQAANKATLVGRSVNVNNMCHGALAVVGWHAAQAFRMRHAKGVRTSSHHSHSPLDQSCAHAVSAAVYCSVVGRLRPLSLGLCRLTSLRKRASLQMTVSVLPRRTHTRTQKQKQKQNVHYFLCIYIYTT